MEDDSIYHAIEYSLQPQLLLIYVLIIVISGILFTYSAFQFYIVISDPGFVAYPFESQEKVSAGFLSAGFGFLVVLSGVTAIMYKVIGDILQAQ